MNCKPTLINKCGDELLLFHIDRFLIQYPAYAKWLADAVVSFAADSARVSPAKIQRRYYIRYNVADAMMKSLRAAKAVRHLHEPLRDELYLDKQQAEFLADYILHFGCGSKE